MTGVSFIQDSFKENFDSEPPGTKSNGGGWTIGNTPTYGTATIVTDNAPNQSLKLTDNDYDPNNAYRGVSATRTFPPQTGKFTLETKVRVKRYNNDPQQHFNIAFLDNSVSPKTALKIFYAGDSWKYYVNGVPVILPAANLLDKWTTIRVMFDITHWKMDLSFTSDEYTTNNTQDPNLDKTTGTFTVKGLDIPADISNVSKVNYFPQNYVGEYYIDYLTMDNAPPIWTGILTTNKRADSVKLSWTSATDDLGAISGYSIFEGSY